MLLCEEGVDKISELKSGLRQPGMREVSVPTHVEGSFGRMLTSNGESCLSFPYKRVGKVRPQL